MRRLPLLLRFRHSTESADVRPWFTQTMERVTVATVLAVTLTVSFHGLAWWNAHRWANHPFRWNLQLPGEASLPFQPHWIWVYLAYFPICASPVFFREMWRDIVLFRRTACGYALQFALALPCFLLPFQMNRPDLSHASTLSEQAIAWLYQLDPGFNIFPSLHVANTVFLACWTWRLRGPRTGMIFWLMALLISWSTLAVKQHYLIDLPTGAALGAGCFLACFRRTGG